MARHCRFLGFFSLLWTVLLATCGFAFGQVSKTSPKASSSLAGAGSATFLVAPALPLSGTPGSVATGDLNGDGTLDLVVANVSAGKVSVQLGKGNGQFAPAVDYSVGRQPAFVLLADVNGDGKLDIVVCNEADGTVSILLGKGDGTLEGAITYSALSDPVHVATGDLTGDGKPDLIVAGKASNTIAVLLNDGTGHFPKSIPYNIGRSPQSLAIGDFDGNGHIDVASANVDGTVSILFGRGDASFRSVSSLKVASTPLSSIVTGDFNSDGKADLAVTQAGTKVVTVLLGRGDGTFQPGSTYSVGSNPAFVVAADVNNDNTPDLITANQSGNSFSVLLGNGDGTFKPALDFTVGNSPRALAVGDFNGDGHLDLAIANFSDHTIGIALGNGDGTFKAARSYSVDLDRKSVAAGDLRGEGKQDLVVTNFCGIETTCSSAGTVSVLLDVGDGTYRLASSYALGIGPVSVALADVNGDNKLDLVAINRGDKSVSVLLGNGDGTFQPALTYPLVNSPTSLAIGDLNKDGKADLAIAGDCGSPNCAQPGAVSVLFGNGDGSFQSGATYAVGYSPSSIAVGDLNGDKNLDLVIANECGNDSTCQAKGKATVLIGDGKGAFKPAPDVQLGSRPSSLALGHLRGAGALDLVATYRGDNKVAVLQGNGDGTFKSPVTYLVGAAPSAVLVADFNGDGKLDVAVADFKDSKISVLFGNGDGTLQSAVHYPVGAGPESLATINQHKGGHADLVSANGNGGLIPRGSNVTVLRNPGNDTGSFPSTTTIARTGGPNPSTYGQQLMFTATVTGDGVHGTPTGTVAFTDNGNSFDPSCDSVPLQTVDNNTAKAVCTTTLLSAGTHADLVATYSGDNNYQGSSATLVPPQIVNKADTTTVLTAIPAQQSSYLQSVTFTALVTGAFGGSPTGTVNFTDNGNAIPNCTAVPLVPQQNGSTATCTTTSLAVGSHTIQGTYGGDNNYNGSQGSIPYTVVKANTTTTVTAVPASQSEYLQLVTFTAFVTGENGGSPTGTVSFTDNGNAIPNCTAVPLVPQQNGSTATCTTTSLAVGSHTIQGSYSGDNNYKSSQGSIPYTVTKADTTTSLTANPPGQSQYLQPVTFTATVTGAFGGSPTGTVSFTDNGNAIPNCTAVPLVPQQNGSTATCTTTSLAVGSHTIQGSYSGDNNYKSSQGSIPYTVTKADTTTSLTANPPGQSQYLQPVTFTATVTGARGMPTGTVSFTDNSIAIPNCTAVPLQNGIANCTTTSLAVGQHSITATYSGDSNFNSSNGSIPYRVTQAPTTTSASSTPNPSAIDQPVAIKAVVTGQNGGTPTGTVNFADANSPIPGCTGLQLAPQQGGGSAVTCTTNSLSLGTHSQITATYIGDGNFLGSSTTLTPAQVVQIATTTTALSPTSPSVINQPVTFTATVTPEFSGPILPTGTVTFTDNGNLINDPNCPNPANLNQSTGQAQCTTTRLKLGSHTITAAYSSGDNNFSGSNGSATQVVNQAMTTTGALTSSLNPAVSTQVVTFTVTVTPQYLGTTLPTGTVTFYVNGAAISPSCTGVTLTPSSGRAQCSTNLLPSGLSLPITATYSGDMNFITSTTSTPLPQTVQDFSPPTATTDKSFPVPVAPGSSNNPATFSVLTQTVTETATPLYGFLDSLAFSCSAMSDNPVIPLTCTLNPNGLMTTVTVTAGTSSEPTPVIPYTVTITATDTRVMTLSHSSTFPVNVLSAATAINVLPGSPGSTTATFAGPPGVTITFSQNTVCPLVIGSGLNVSIPNGGEAPSILGMSCATPNPATATFDSSGLTSVTVTVNTTGNTTAGLKRRSSAIFAAFWLGLPAVVLIGSLRRNRLSLKAMFQWLGILLVLIALLYGIGCGGGFTRTPTPSGATPTGAYSILVQGMDSNNVAYSAVVPVNVGH